MFPRQSDYQGLYSCACNPLLEILFSSSVNCKHIVSISFTIRKRVYTWRTKDFSAVRTHNFKLSYLDNLVDSGYPVVPLTYFLLKISNHQNVLQQHFPPSDSPYTLVHNPIYSLFYLEQKTKVLIQIITNWFSRTKPLYVSTRLNSIVNKARCLYGASLGRDTKSLFL